MGYWGEPWSAELGSLHVAASDTDGGGADGLDRVRTSSDAVCM